MSQISLVVRRPHGEGPEAGAFAAASPPSDAQRREAELALVLGTTPFTMGKQMRHPKITPVFAVMTFALTSAMRIDRDAARGWRVRVCGVAHAEITVTKARIGCLDIQVEGNMTNIVGQACNGKWTCSYKAPTQDQYRRMGVAARGRAFCTQGMEITYQCGHNDFRTVNIAGDAWNNPPAQLACTPPSPPKPTHVPQPGLITVTGARIGCLDIQTDPNMTDLVATACNDKKTCSYKAPTEDEYKRAGVQAKTRSFCTQAMEITYNCGHNDPQPVMVQGDAWKTPPAQLACNPPPLPHQHVFAPGTGPINVTKARIGCLDIQTEGNL